MKCTCTIKMIPTIIGENCPWHGKFADILGINVIVDPSLPKTIILLKGGMEELEINLVDGSIKIHHKPTN